MVLYCLSTLSWGPGFKRPAGASLDFKALLHGRGLQISELGGFVLVYSHSDSRLHLDLLSEDWENSETGMVGVLVRVSS